MFCSYRSLISYFFLCSRRIFFTSNLHWSALVGPGLYLSRPCQHLLLIHSHHFLYFGLLFLLPCLLIPVFSQLSSLEYILPELSKNWTLLNLLSIGSEDIFLLWLLVISTWVSFPSYFAASRGKGESSAQHLFSYGYHKIYEMIHCLGSISSLLTFSKNALMESGWYPVISI